MAQEKKALYDLYPRMLDRVVNDMKKGMPGKEGKKATRKDIIQKIMDFQPNLAHSLDFLIWSEELFCEKQGNHAIFPESSVVLDNLLRAKYQMDSPEGFTLPYESFFVAIPHGYSFDGVHLESFMVTMVPYQTSELYTTVPFCEAMGIKAPDSYVHEHSRPDAYSIAITYRDPVTRAGYIRTLQIDENLPKILKCQSAMEFRDVLGDYDSKIGVIDLNKDELEVQFLAVKLVAALGVYHMATGGSRLSDGFPGKQEPRINNRDKTQRLYFSTLKNSTRFDDAPVPKEAFYRTWYFRQLRDERFYRGEHEKTPRGSRYSFVSDTVVGQKVSPHTQQVK